MQIPRRPIHPKPYQQPHPKLYYACTNPSSLEQTGKRGIGALVLGLGGPEDIARKNALYRESFRNRNPADQVGLAPNEHLAALCLTIVLDDREKARRIGLKGQRFFTESLNRWYAGGPPPKAEDYHDDADEQLKALSDQKEKIVAYLASEKIEFDPGKFGHLDEVKDAYGTVEDCIRFVQKLFDAGADEILFLVQMGTVPHEATMETIHNIGEHLIPHFKNGAAAWNDGAPMARMPQGRAGLCRHRARPLCRRTRYRGPAPGGVGRVLRRRHLGALVPLYRLGHL